MIDNIHVILMHMKGDDNMTDSQIRLFLSIAHYGSFSKAASSLFISEPAVSRSMRMLEQELGCSLIARKKGSKELILTDEGKQFLLIANTWVQLLEDAKRLSSERTITTIRIASVESYSISLMPQVYLSCMNELQNLRLIIDSMHGAEAMRQLSHNLQDLVIIGSDLQERGVVSRPLFRECIMLVCKPGLFSPGEIKLDELDVTREIVSSWAPDYHAWSEYWLGLETRSRLYARTVGNLPEIINNGEMWTLVPATLADCWKNLGLVDVHRLSVEPPARVCYAVQRRNDESEAAAKIINNLCETASRCEGVEIIE